jgi:hypothetical protein
MSFDKFFLRLFQILAVLLFAISASGAILGFAGIYHPLNEYIAVILIIAAVLPFVWKQSHIFKEHTAGRLYHVGVPCCWRCAVR